MLSELSNNRLDLVRQLTSFLAMSCRQVGCSVTSQSRKQAFKIPLIRGASCMSLREVSSVCSEGTG